MTIPGQDYYNTDNMVRFITTPRPKPKKEPTYKDI